ncbi:MAG TPA: hypothetical protein VH934_22330 [Xanthobacteraceae bacterium]|jgi:hypothetical protein
MRTAIAAAIILMLCADVRARTLTECGRSDGYAYYFSGGLVPADKSGLRKDGIDGGRIILNLANDEVDLIIKDSRGTTESVKQADGKILVQRTNNGLIAMMVIYGGGTTTEHYVFQLDDRGNGTLVWSAIRTAAIINKMSLMTAQCHGPR